MSWSDLLRPGFRAVRRNWAPFLLLQTLAALLVLAYYRLDAVRSAAEILSMAKAAGGVYYVLVSGFLAGGALPQIARVATGRVTQIDRAFWLDTLYSGFVFAMIAVEVDAFYRLQGTIFGHGSDVATLVKKTALDMFVATPIAFNPTGMILLHARKVCFAPRRMREAFTWSFYRDWVIPTFPLNWAFWIPIVMCVYALPANLQFPSAQLSEACWSLFFVFMADEASS